MASYPLLSALRAALCRAPFLHLAAKRPAVVPAAVLALALASMTGCMHSARYRGTGALQLSGEQSSLLASHTVELTYCPGEPSTDPPHEPFSVLVIGALDRCVLPGSGTSYMFRVDPGTECTLQFAEGSHTLRVTDAKVDYGEVMVGGDDITSAKHAVYTFSGERVASADDVSRRCDALRRRHELATK